MNNSPVIVGLPNLSTWYGNARENQTNITVYKGYGKPNKKSMETLTTIKVGDKQAALEAMNNFFKLYEASGGQFHIFTTHYQNGGTGFETDFYLPPSTHIAGVHGNNSFHSINGYQANQPQPQSTGIYGANIAEAIANESAKAVEMAMLKRDLEDLKATKVPDAPKAFFAKIGALMYEDPEGFQKAATTLFQGFAMTLNQVGQLVKGTQPQLGTIGYDKPIQSRRLEDPGDDQLEEEENVNIAKPMNCIAAMSEADKVAFVRAWEKIMQHYPDKTPRNVMDGLMLAVTLKPDLLQQLPVQ